MENNSSQQTADQNVPKPNEPKKFQHNPHWNGKIYWPNTLFIVGSPLLMFGLMPYVLYTQGFALVDFLIYSLMIFTTGISITVGYHRLFAHQTFETHPAVKLFLLVFGAGCLENSAFKWSSDHRYHHRFVDKDSDPYSINKGFFYAHMGWIFYADPDGRSTANVPDLANDKLVMWQHRWYLPVGMFVAFGIPTLLGFLVGRPLSGFFWGGLFRTVFLHHMTFFINSACHMFGTQPYSTKNTARDSWVFALLTNGEGYHNFHHAFGSDYRNGVRWYHWDPSKWFISTLERLGLASDLKRTPDSIILKARMETTLDEFRLTWKDRPLPAQVEQMRASLEAKLAEFQVKLREFQAWKEEARQKGARYTGARKRLLKRKLREEKRSLEQGLAEFRAQLEMARRQPAFA